MCLTAKQYTREFQWEHIIYKTRISLKYITQITDYYDEHKDELGQTDGEYLEEMNKFKRSWEQMNSLSESSKKWTFKQLDKKGLLSSYDLKKLDEDLEEQLEEEKEHYVYMKKTIKEARHFKSMGYEIQYV